MNEYDSDYVGRILINSGLQPTDDYDDADLILINTCTVRAKAQQKAFSLAGRMLSLKKRRPDLIIGIMGCIAQQEGLDLFARFPGLDLVIGPREISRISKVLDQVEKGHEKVLANDLSVRRPYSIKNNGYFKGRVKSQISIMEGCNNYCSYCIVPYVRGAETSRSPDEILEEAKHLISLGIREVTLLGQNVNSYFFREREGVDFPTLLRKLNDLEGLSRIRFTTSHPKDLSAALINCFKELDNLCPHIHLPFQAGSNRILKRMNRGYTREKYIDLIDALRSARPDIAITSDVIVGFPGESDKDFKMSLDLINKIEFDNLYSFKYSDRKGTLAEKMDVKVDENEKSERLKTLQKEQKGITLRKNMKLIGKTEAVLVEGESKRGKQYTGRTGTNKIVNFYFDYDLIGKLVKVKIEDSFINSMRGKFIETCI